MLRIFAPTIAEVAQLVELQPSKLVVASSSLVFRSAKTRNRNVSGFLFGFTPVFQGIGGSCMALFSSNRNDINSVCRLNGGRSILSRDFSTSLHFAQNDNLVIIPIVKVIDRFHR